MKKVVRWDKNRIGNIHLSYSELCDFDSFVIKLLESLKQKQRYSLLLKINFRTRNSDKDRYAMIGEQIGFNYEDSEDLLEFEGLHETFIERLNITLDNYNVDRINSFQLMYVLIEDIPELKLKNVNNIPFNKEFTNTKDSKSRFNFIPLTVDMNYFGQLIINDCSTYLDRINKQRNTLNVNDIEFEYGDKMYLYNDKYIILSKKDKGNEGIIHRSVYNAKSGNLIDEVMDTVIGDNLFIRQIGNVSLTISDNKVTKVESKKILSPIRFKPKSLKDEANPFIGSWDVEAFDDIDGYSKVYALGFAVLGKESKMYYLDNDTTSEDLVLKCLNDMLVNEYNGYIFYTHNFGNYDSIFLMKILKEENIRLGCEHYKTSDISRDGKMLKLTIKVKRSLSDRKPSIIGARKDPGYNTITIVDSLNILNQSLDKLGRSFEVPVTKGSFPHSFVKRETLHYVGNTPDYKFWEKISLEDYKELVKADWNLKEECLNYLDKDLTSLVMIMNKFSEYINRKYYLQVTDSLTISRLALNIFLKDYLKDSKLPIINKGVFSDIKQAYYGGVTEVYKPYGTNLLHYDVNSLYPFAALNPMPGTECVHMENIDGSVNLNDLFGYFHCEIKSGDSYLGLLPVHHKEGMIMPNGTWEGWYFSEELKLAAENGYTINVLSGYHFNKINDVFTDYVVDLYNIKSSTKDKVEKDIAKRLLNHLLGRFGLNIVKPITRCVDSSELSLIFSTKRVIGRPEKITDNDFRITYINQIDKDICEDHGVDYIKVQKLTPKTDMEKLNEFRDVSLTTAAAVTAYARIYMSKIKLDIINKGGNIYYTDTDSIVTDKPLDESLVGDGLGEFKLEYKIEQGYYISNKTYYIDLAEKLFDDSTKEYISYIVKSKAVLSESLNLDSFKLLYGGNNVNAMQRSAVKNYFMGSVKLKNKSVELKHDSYTKRNKVYKDNIWVDTLPLVLQDGSKVLQDGSKVLQDGNKVIKKKFRTKSVMWYTNKFKSLINILLLYLYWLFVAILVFVLHIPYDSDFDCMYGPDLLNLDSDFDYMYDRYQLNLNLNYDSNFDEILELRYSDDYAEEPIEVEYDNISNNINNTSKGRSLLNSFLDLFMDKRSSINGIYKNPSDLIDYSDMGYCEFKNLDNSYIERPQVLNTVMKHHIDSLVDEVASIKKDYSVAEFKRIHSNVVVGDALELLNKALRGSPISGVNSPIIQEGYSYRTSPSLNLNTSFENTPNITEYSPIISRSNLFPDKSSPLLNKVSSILDKSSPLSGRGNPFLDKSSTLSGRGSPFLDKSSPLSGRGSPFLDKISPLSGRGSPFLDRSSPLKTSTSFVTKDQGLLIDSVSSVDGSTNAVENTINVTTEYKHNAPRKYPIRTVESPSVLKRFGYIWPDNINIESPSTIKRYGWVSPSGNSVLEDFSPLSKRQGYVFPEGFTLKKDYHVITEHNNVYKAYSPYTDVD